MAYDDFFRVYANLPIKIREQIVLSIDGKPITWNVAYSEISNETPLGKKIYEALKKTKII